MSSASSACSSYTRSKASQNVNNSKTVRTPFRPTAWRNVRRALADKTNQQDTLVVMTVKQLDSEITKARQQGAAEYAQEVEEHYINNSGKRVYASRTSEATYDKDRRRDGLESSPEKRARKEAEQQLIDSGRRKPKRYWGLNWTMNMDDCVKFITEYRGEKPLSLRGLALKFKLRDGKGNYPATKGGTYVRDHLIQILGKEMFSTLNLCKR